MEIKEAYAQAMRDQAPGMFNELRKSGALDAHLQKIAEQASGMATDLAADEPKLPNGLVKDPTRRREIEEQVRSTLIEFRATGEPDVDGERIPETQPQNG